MKMNKISFIVFIGLVVIFNVNCLSLNDASVRPRGERAESSGIDSAPQNSKQVNSNSTTSEQQLEFDFINLPGYGILDEKNSSASGNFSCYERRYGYYADLNKQCTMFHLCYPVKDPSTNEIVYQRFSFACSENSIFDQQHLLCLDESNLATKCENSAEYFGTSNQRLVTSLQQNAPGLFALSEEGAVINTANANKSTELEESASEQADGVDESISNPSVYSLNNPAFI